MDIYGLKALGQGIECTQTHTYIVPLLKTNVFNFSGGLAKVAKDVTIG